ncbi:MAG TPA: hypothetical protein VFZ53_25360 [Polyangiaceae bacterium]
MMRDSGRLHVFALPPGHSPVHQFIRGLPASLLLGDDPDAPTPLTVLEPLRFDAVTLFPAFYLTRDIETAEPRIRIARGMALHRLSRLEGTCTGYVGFGTAEEERTHSFDAGAILGQYAPDLEVGQVDVPCDALGGASDDEPYLEEHERDGETTGESEQNALRLTPVYDEEGAYHYEATELRIGAAPTQATASVWIKASENGVGILANARASLLDQKPGWKRIELEIGHGFRIEGWVEANRFEHDPGAGGWDYGHGHLGGGSSTKPRPTFCAGTLEPATPIFTRRGVRWATVATRIEGVFEREESILRLANFLGPYRDSFCGPRWNASDSQGHADCIEDAIVRATDVVLSCPAGKPR